MDSRTQQSRRKQARKRKEYKKIAVLLVMCFIMLLAVVSAWHRSRQNSELVEDEQTTEEETFQVKLPEGMEYNTIETSSETEEADKPDDIQTEEKTETEAETATETEETQSQYLKSLSGLEPGMVLDMSRIDFQNSDKYFMSWKIEEGDNLYERINGKSYQKNDYVPLSTLRYLKMPHYNYDGQIQVGEIIVNEDVMENVLSVFKKLFEEKYRIQSMYLVDNYWTGDPDTTDSASIEENNTSGFCYRQITGGEKLSNHAYGRAIDLNPQQNPYVSYSSGSPKWSHSNANDYIKRDTGLPHVITHEDAAYRIFREYGFKWGGDWTNPKDYQHFDKN